MRLIKIESQAQHPRALFPGRDFDTTLRVVEHRIAKDGKAFLIRPGPPRRPARWPRGSQLTGGCRMAPSMPASSMLADRFLDQIGVWGGVAGSACPGAKGGPAHL